MNQHDLQGIAPNSISHGGRATPAGVPGHDVQFYDSEDFLVREVARFLAEGIRAGQPLIIVATQAHRKQVASRAYGEMVDLLWKDGNVEGAIALEEMWNALAARYSFTLLCTYAMDNFHKEEHTASFQRICAQHGQALPTED